MTCIHCEETLTDTRNESLLCVECLISLDRLERCDQCNTVGDLGMTLDGLCDTCRHHINMKERQSK